MVSPLRAIGLSADYNRREEGKSTASEGLDDRKCLTGLPPARHLYNGKDAEP
jgi:hypothetical protein